MLAEERGRREGPPSKSAFLRARIRTFSERERGTVRGARGAGEEMGARVKGDEEGGATCQGERRVTHSLRVTYTNRRTSRAGRQLATCSLLCSHTRARINLSVSCHVQRSHSLSPAAYRHSRPSCCRRLRGRTLLAPYLINKSAVRSVFLEIPTKFERDRESESFNFKNAPMGVYFLTEQIE